MIETSITKNKLFQIIICTIPVIVLVLFVLREVLLVPESHTSDAQFTIRYGWVLDFVSVKVCIVFYNYFCLMNTLTE